MDNKENNENKDNQKKNNRLMQVLFLVLLALDSAVNYAYARGFLGESIFRIAFAAVLALSVFGSISGTINKKKNGQSAQPNPVSSKSMYVVLVILGVWVYTLVIAVNGIPA